MNWPYVTVTAFTVSLDSFIAGLSLSLNKKKSLLLPTVVALVTYVLCLSASLAGVLLKDFLQKYVKFAGAFILTCLGVAALLKNEELSLQDIDLAQCFAIGFGVGLDGAAAALSLTISGEGDVVFMPLMFAAMHFATVFLGQKLAQSAKVGNSNVMSAVMFFVLAAAKLLDL